MRGVSVPGPVAVGAAAAVDQGILMLRVQNLSAAVDHCRGKVGCTGIVPRRRASHDGSDGGVSSMGRLFLE